MKRMGMIVLLLVLLPGVNARAAAVAGVDLAPQVTVAGETLQLNGFGLRTKFFFKIYVGSLYTARPVVSAGEAVALSGAKLIRMNFLHSKVGRQKIIAAFAEGFEKNSPHLAGASEVQQFLDLFTADFVDGDTVDLELAADGKVTARHNGRLLGTIRSTDLVRGILLIYLGDHPADEDLKAGMLGRS